MTTVAASASSVKPMAATKLGEELPIFCEKCGYSLFGLTQLRCEHCEILHFHCPECGHHQPINTLRPAAQRIIGRGRMLWLGLVVLFKLNFFGWLLFAWVGMGAVWSFQYIGGARSFGPRPVSYEEIIAFTLFAVAFSLFSRMLLLRWRDSSLVGIVLGILVAAAIAAGTELQRADYRPGYPVASPWTPEFLALIGWTGGVIVIGTILSLPFWHLLIRVFLPPTVGTLLIEWQRTGSDQPIASLARE